MALPLAVLPGFGAPAFRQREIGHRRGQDLAYGMR